MTDQPQQPSPYLQPPPAADAVGGPTPYDVAPPPPRPVAGPFDGPWGPLADWGTRVGAYLIDSVIALVGLVPYVIGFVLITVGAGTGSSNRYDADTLDSAPDPTNTGLVVTGVILVVAGVLLMLGIQIWNRAFKQGRTGQSVGKKVLGIKLVGERTGQPIGAGMAFVRDLCHVVDGFAYIGYLWPLWDGKRQTFADKILDTVVVRVPRS
ncbi:RDD family protein [Pedococcus sp. KACC 23699]|uniref:RDD family protein n=1 Tax=Pedococcus sp. KACC 23699 TaxID=3149228 RepID=A0AAU7JXF9_9MICO